MEKLPICKSLPNLSIIRGLTRNYEILKRIAVSRYGWFFASNPQAEGIIRDLDRLVQVQKDITAQYVDFTMDMFDSLSTINLETGSVAKREVEAFYNLHFQVESSTFCDKMEAWIYRNCPYLKESTDYTKVLVQEFKERFRVRPGIRPAS